MGISDMLTFGKMKYIIHDQRLIDKEHKTQTYISVFTENNIKSHYPQIGIYMETYKSERHIGPRYLSEAPACSNRAPTPRPSHTTPTKKEEEKKSKTSPQAKRHELSLQVTF